MGALSYTAGATALVIGTAPWAVAGVLARRRLLAAWRGPAGVVVACVIALVGLVIVTELVGVVGQFRRWPVATVNAVVALVLVLVLWRRRRTPVAEAPDDRPEAYPVVALLLAAVCVLVVTAVWAGRDARVLHTGPDDIDSMHYHLSHSARFVQDHSLANLHEVSAGDASALYPSNGELLDAIAMLGPLPDLFTLPINLLFCWLALLSCWVIGHRWRAAPAAVAAGSLVLVIPLLGAASSGPGLNDVPALAGVLAGCAVLARGVGRAHPEPGESAAIVVAGLAFGFAAGTKLPALPMALLLIAAGVLLARGRRMRVAGLLAVGALAGGGFWFARDWALVGSPLPFVDLRVGGHGLPAVPTPAVDGVDFSVAHYLGDWHVLSDLLRVQLDYTSTKLWPVFALVAVAGCVGGLLRRGDPVRRAFAAVAAIGFLVYLVTPTTALGPEGFPLLFGSNLRYALIAFTLALVSAAGLVGARWTVWPTAVFTGFVGYCAGLSVEWSRAYRSEGVAIALVVGGIALLAVLATRRTPVAGVAVVAGGALAAVVAGGWLLDSYADARYAALRPPAHGLFHWAQRLHDERIGMVGFPVQYPFYGDDLDNHVQYVGHFVADDAYVDITNCADWQRALVNGHYTYVVVQLPRGVSELPFTGWTASLPGAVEVFRNSAGTVYQLTGDASGAATGRCSQG